MNSTLGSVVPLAMFSTESPLRSGQQSSWWMNLKTSFRWKIVVFFQGRWGLQRGGLSLFSVFFVLKRDFSGQRLFYGVFRACEDGRWGLGKGHQSIQGVKMEIMWEEYSASAIFLANKIVARSTSKPWRYSQNWCETHFSAKCVVVEVKVYRFPQPLAWFPNVQRIFFNI